MLVARRGRKPLTNSIGYDKLIVSETEFVPKPPPQNPNVQIVQLRAMLDQSIWQIKVTRFRRI